MGKIEGMKKGAASFYIVAISTLILMIVAASFAAVIIAEITRTSNNDLAQSAYDAALAGVEDAKLAFYSYQNCLESGNNERCPAIMELVREANSGDEDCGMVAKALGRIEDGATDTDVLVQESTIKNDMQQYYTCTMFTTTTPDYLVTLNSASAASSKAVMRAKFEDGVSAKDIAKIRVSWKPSDASDETYNYTDFDEDGGIFQGDSTIPVISVGLVQTAKEFGLNDFEMTEDGGTDRGTLYLVPTDNKDLERADGKYEVTWNGEHGKNMIDESGFLKSNDKIRMNLPYAVFCDTDTSAVYPCSVDIELPAPVGGERSDETFMFVLSMPYAQGSSEAADISLEFFCGEGSEACGSGEFESEETSAETLSRAPLKDVQINIDSTGRANDLYRRVKVRLEPEGKKEGALLNLMYAVEAFGGDKAAIEKIITPTCEQNFTNNPNCKE